MTAELQSADSFAKFYRETYGAHMVGQAAAGRVGTTLTKAAQPGGRYPAPPTPDLLLIAIQELPMWGEVDVGAGRFRRQFQPSDLLLAPPMTAVDNLLDQPHRVLCLSVPYPHLKTLAPEAGLPVDGCFGPLHADAFSDPAIIVLMERMWSEADDGNPHGGLFLDGAVLAIAAALMSHAALAAGRMKGGLAPWQVRRASDLLKSRLAEDVELSEVAAVTGLSPYHFARAFKASTGLPPHRYQMMLRVDRAKEMLISTGLSVTEIANACGFASSQHMATVFRKVVRVTPTAFRREHIA